MGLASTAHTRSPRLLSTSSPITSCAGDGRRETNSLCIFEKGRRNFFPEKRFVVHLSLGPQAHTKRKASVGTGLLIGLLAGWCNTALTEPLDTLATFRQVRPECSYPSFAIGTCPTSRPPCAVRALKSALLLAGKGQESLGGVPGG